MGHILQMMIARKTLQFLKKNYTISHDRELQKWPTFYKSLSQEKLRSFSRKLYYTVSCDSSLQKFTSTASDRLEK